jgi:hypothetical protein
MTGTFALLDLPSQALAVEQLLKGRTDEEKLAWLCGHGRLVLLSPAFSGSKPSYLFESVMHLRCVFFIVGDKFVFIGDHTTYTVKE